MGAKKQVKHELERRDEKQFDEKRGMSILLYEFWFH